MMSVFFYAIKHASEAWFLNVQIALYHINDINQAYFSIAQNFFKIAYWEWNCWISV